MAPRSTSLLLVLLAILFVVAEETSASLKGLLSAPKMHSCVSQVVKKFEGKIPDVVLELEDLLREINRPLYDLPITKLLKHRDSKTDLDEARVMTDEISAQAGTCKQFQDSIGAAIKRTKCADDLKEMSNIYWRDYDQKVPKEYPEFDILMGHKEVCSLIAM